MIRVESITISEFRGIRDLTLDFNEKSFAVCGPNGTGKSGVVDALEFALTGNVSRLSGEGRGEVSLKQHGPHVDRRDDPDSARVKLRIKIPSLGETATIERSLKNPGAAQVTPAEPSIIEVLRQVEAHPEIVLSRRELIRYVLATPGKRAEEVQALLHLEQVEQVRGILQKIANACEKKIGLLSEAVKQATDNLLRALEISGLAKEKVLAVTNAQRATLGLPALIDLAETTSLKDGMATPAPAQPQRIPKVQAIADIRGTLETLADIDSKDTARHIAEVISDLTALAEDPVIKKSMKREAFFMSGLELAEAGTCPFCDIPWELDKLKMHIKAKLDHLKEVSIKREAAEKKLAPLIIVLRKVKASMDTLAGYGALTTPHLAMKTAHECSTFCRKAVERLTALLPFNETITALENILKIPQTVLDAIKELEQVVAALPEPTKLDAARDWLVVAQERLETWRDVMRKNKTAREQAQRARQVSDIYAASSDKVLAGIYASVENDFSLLYSFLNREDEEKFRAKLIPSLGKLGFDVDFYGRGFFPPGAYHSEGHQDSMGVCLYLALMKHLQGENFTLAVLDDVLMSVDTGHRREFCSLLKEEFPNTQFIITTHDPVWLRHLKTEGIIGGKSAVHFRKWSVDHGPTRWDARDVWGEIEDYRKENDVRAAASLLRYYLEYEFAELCQRLRAEVEYRGDGQYQVGELLPPAIVRMRTLYRQAKDAANSWNQKEIIEQLGTREAEFAKLAMASKAEQWQVNVAIHYNSWDNLGKEDFAPVAKAFQDLLRAFMCVDCGEYLRVSPERNAAESIRCECGKTMVNLRRKSG